MGLTMLRLLLLPMFVWILLTMGDSHQPNRLRWLAIGLFSLMAVTDKLDGYFARRLNQMTRLGAVLDPIADKLLVGSALFLLSFSWIAPAGYAVPVAVLLAVYGKDIGNTLGGLMLFWAVGRAEIGASRLGRISTVLQFALVMATLLAPDMARFSGSATGLLLNGLWWGVFLAAAGTTVDYAEEASHQHAVYRRRRAAMEA
jgi:CDP-diacylglycerol--glycerol-3-phosphate 3-phosphatidyltransferase/cardiolipin synthase